MAGFAITTPIFANRLPPHYPLETGLLVKHYAKKFAGVESLSRHEEAFGWKSQPRCK